MWREPYLPGSVIYVLHQIHPCLCLCVVFFIFSVEPCLYDLCVCVYTYLCVCTHTCVYVCTHTCVCVYTYMCVCVCVCVAFFIIFTPARMPECGVHYIDPCPAAWVWCTDGRWTGQLLPSVTPRDFVYLQWENHSFTQKVLHSIPCHQRNGESALWDLNCTWARHGGLRIQDQPFR